MRSHPRVARAAAVALAVALAAAGCSDDESIDPDEDEAVIDDAILTVDDLPDGFDEAEATDDDDDEITAECLEEAGVDVDAVDDAVVVRGDPVEFSSFSEELLVGITAQITSYDDVDVIDEELEGFVDDAFIDCVVQDSIDEAEADDGDDVLAVDEIAGEVVDPPVDGDDAASVRLTFVTEGLPSRADHHLVRVGRFRIALEVLAINDEPDELVEDLLEAMVDRIEDATD